jgi:hypothetical protein
MSAGVLRRYYELLDGPDVSRSSELLSPQLRFTILFSQSPGTAQEFSGGRAEFDGYMAQRGAPPWTHRVLADSSDGRLEIAFGETRLAGETVATFVAAIRLDEAGLIDRYIVGRSPAVLFELTADTDHDFPT